MSIFLFGSRAALEPVKQNFSSLVISHLKDESLKLPINVPVRHLSSE
jgi:hypothetical protein